MIGLYLTRRVDPPRPDPHLSRRLSLLHQRFRHVLRRTLLRHRFVHRQMPLIRILRTPPLRNLWMVRIHKSALRFRFKRHDPPPRSNTTHDSASHTSSPAPSSESL